MKTNNLLKELENCRKRWLEAHRRGDVIMERLWERVGKKLKEILEKKMKGEGQNEL